MTLYEAKKGGQYTVKGLYLEEGITRRLQALGLNDGTKVNVLNRRKRGAMIIQVRGTRLALGRHITTGIEVGGMMQEKDDKNKGDCRKEDMGHDAD
ncbi:MAG: ferrous iron transport protein A [Clostridiales bacterium]|nr:ferrous iron transport protein A [Clostridiales bacterium]